MKYTTKRIPKKEKKVLKSEKLLIIATSQSVAAVH